jgi:hypothetical protein
MEESNFESANVNGTAPTVTPESTDQPASDSAMKLYQVSVAADVQLCLTGCLNVYAVDAEEAWEKVQAKIDDESVDDDLQMEDDWSGVTSQYGYLKCCSGFDIQIGGVEMVDDNVDPADVLETEVKELQSSIMWNTDALAKQKVFLETLLDDDDENGVAA